MTNRERDAEILRQRLADAAAQNTDGYMEGIANRDAAASGAESPTEYGNPTEPVTAAPPVAVSYANVILAALPQDNGSFSCMVFPDKATATAKMDVAAFKTNGGRFFAAKEIVPKVKVTL